MSKVVLDVIVVLIIILIGGFFAGSEMALVSLREGQVRALSKRGKRGQRAARLAQDPNRFFSAVQIGVTLATLFSGTYGAETLAGYLKSGLAREYHLSPAWAGTIAFIVVTICITFFSLVLGELAPKRIALQRAPTLALLAAPASLGQRSDLAFAQRDQSHLGTGEEPPDQDDDQDDNDVEYDLAHFRSAARLRGALARCVWPV